MHETVYLSSRGWDHFVDDDAPVLGVSLRGPARVAAHVLFVACALLAVVVPAWRWTPVLVLAALSLLAASLPKRLPNHFAVAWFMLLAFSADRVFGLSPGHGAATRTRCAWCSTSRSSRICSPACTN
ncbi:hypothetical protein [Nonomuraea sp. NPDC050691]|uniref:hypothetical protein n=1 Tax=Nonomuraea sp. NPDC050691 TaxID=3155661 RepID=UPI0033D8DC9A